MLIAHLLSFVARIRAVFLIQALTQSFTTLLAFASNDLSRLHIPF
jgi:hypothetical protein